VLESQANRAVDRVTAGGVLAFHSTEHHVFRVAVVSIVLILAVGQNAGLLCNVLCHPREVSTAECHHHEDGTAPSSVTNDDTCTVVVGVAAFVREDVRRAVSAPDMQHAIAIPRYQFSPSTTETRVGIDSAREWSLEKRPLETSLRI
jgi:hypothetical protein